MLRIDRNQTVSSLVPQQRNTLASAGNQLANALGNPNRVDPINQENTQKAASNPFKQQLNGNTQEIPKGGLEKALKTQTPSLPRGIDQLTSGQINGGPQGASASSIFNLKPPEGTTGLSLVPTGPLGANAIDNTKGGRINYPA